MALLWLIDTSVPMAVVVAMATCVRTRKAFGIGNEIVRWPTRLPNRRME